MTANPHWPTRDSLLAKIAQPNAEEAWVEFSNYYKYFIELVLNKLHLTREQKEDISQEVIRNVWLGIQQEQFRSQNVKFKTWLSSLIRNTAYTYMRDHLQRQPSTVPLESQDLIPTMWIYRTGMGELHGKNGPRKDRKAL